MSSNQSLGGQGHRIKLAVRWHALIYLSPKRRTKDSETVSEQLSRRQCRRRGRRLQHRPEPLAGHGRREPHQRHEGPRNVVENRSEQVVQKASCEVVCCGSVCRIDPIITSNSPINGGGLHTPAPFNADFYFVPAVLENKRCAGYYHIA